MNCQELREQIPAFLNGDSSAEELRQCEQHLEHCADCRSEVEEFRNVISQLCSTYHSIPDRMTLPQWIPPKAVKPIRTMSWWSWFMGRWQPALGGALLLLSAIGVWIWIELHPKELVPMALSHLQSGSLKMANGGLLEKIGEPLLDETPYEVVREASLRFHDRASIVLAPGSEFEFKESGLCLTCGGGDFDIESASRPFSVVTNCGRISVYGTRFRLVTDPSATVVWLERGALSVENHSLVMPLSPGEMALIRPQQAPHKAGSTVATAPFLATESISIVISRLEAMSLRGAPHPVIQTVPLGSGSSVARHEDRLKNLPLLPTVSSLLATHTPASVSERIPADSPVQPVASGQYRSQQEVPALHEDD